MPLPDQIKVVVTHVDPLLRAGICASFASCADFELQGSSEVRNGPERCDVVVADYAGAMSLLGHQAGSIRFMPKVVIVTSVDREWEIRQAIERGARGYFLAGCPAAELTDGVRAAHRGQRLLSPQVATRLAESMSGEALTDREQDVLRLVTLGLCNKAIGRRLGIAVGTVKSHLRASFDKLGVTSRTQAAAAIERRGVLAATETGDAPGTASRAAADQQVRALLNRPGSGRVAQPAMAIQ